MAVTDADAHALAYSVMALADSIEDQAMSELLFWVYEHTPCTSCRLRALKQLAARAEETTVTAACVRRAIAQREEAA